MIRFRSRPVAGLILLAVAAAGCGKKGPPLAPLRPVPGAVTDLTARRAGPDLYLGLRVPDRNQDGSRPADLDRVEIYLLTETVRPAGARTGPREPKPVATVAVRPPAGPEDEEQGGRRTGAREADDRPGQGDLVTIVLPFDLAALAPAPEAGAGEMEPAPEPSDPAVSADAAAGEAVAAAPALVRGRLSPPLGLPAIDAPAGRSYVAVGVSRRGQRGRESRPVRVPLFATPPVPPAPVLSHTERAVVIDWSAGAGADARPLPARPTVQLGPVTAYNVYRVAPGEPPAGGATPVNRAPVAAPPVEDPGIEFGQERCYALRAVAAVGALRAESDPSPAACLTPEDVYPPAAPTGLRAVAAEGAVSLIWDASREPDLAGYLVLRGTAPGETLQALTPAPIRETTYRDEAVEPGAAYVYAVVAVDTAVPPNVSPESARVEAAPR